MNNNYRKRVEQKFPCGCQIWEMVDESYSIEYCPKHKAAPLMYEALSDLLCWVNALLPHGLAEHGIIISNPPVAESIKALAKARGEK